MWKSRRRLVEGHRSRGMVGMLLMRRLMVMVGCQCCRGGSGVVFVPALCCYLSQILEGWSVVIKYQRMRPAEGSKSKNKSRKNNCI